MTVLLGVGVAGALIGMWLGWWVSRRTDTDEPDEDYGPGCDCTELCPMGPTCPGGMLARLPGSGCWRTLD